jgi:hypothetical protein
MKIQNTLHKDGKTKYSNKKSNQTTTHFKINFRTNKVSNLNNNEFLYGEEHIVIILNLWTHVSETRILLFILNL